MLGQKKIIEIECFYCHRKFKYPIRYFYQISRAYCDRCKKKHLVNQYHNPAGYKKYKEYLRQVRSQFCRKEKEVIKVNLYIKDGKLFKGEVEIGRIISKNKSSIDVQKYPLGTVSSYQRRFIK